ncbi:amidohydrolase [Aquimarina hainanensis]|uniref:Amidohydrolase n=1 Tax=Aquimarina hainanensis TaxID=1578017 RepID=A0ABW5N819_9FLAO|nr:amidohydrolase [Aquimarina sp. TRL1]QKX05454.1 amidohydrolase [Aquimarina sp. TRL1]
MKNRFLYSLLILCCISCKKDNKPPLTIFHNGSILTINKQNDIVEAMAIRNKKIIAIGNYHILKDSLQKIYSIKEVDLHQNTLMPGIYDSHSHPITGALKDLFQLNFEWDIPADSLHKSMKHYIKHVNSEIVIGGAWASDFFEKNQIDHPLRWLDAINSTIPILLADDTGHNLWVNSAGLKMGNINRDTPDPKNGRIEKDPQGNPNGVLHENASFLVLDKVTFTEEQYAKSIEYAQKQSLSYGIIAIKDADANKKSIETMYKMDQAGAINMFFAMCQSTPKMARNHPLDIRSFVETAKKNKTDNIDPYFIKFFLDGVPTSSRTAAMLCNYKTDHHHPTPTNGFLHITPELLQQDIANFDKEQFIIKIHAAGDRSAREAINAVEYARKNNPQSTQKHELAHASYIHEYDLLRMKTLNIAADLSPYLWFPSPIIDNILATVCDEKNHDFWPIKNLVKHEVHCIAGSDWPSVAVNLNPWVGIEAMVTRKNPTATNTTKAFWSEQKIPLSDALRIFTINGAISMNKNHESGSLEVGKNADFIILDQSIFDIDPDDISEIKVLSTYYKGVECHRLKP